MNSSQPKSAVVGFLRNLRLSVWIFLSVWSSLAFAQTYYGQPDFNSRPVANGPRASFWGSSPGATSLWWEWIAPQDGPAIVGALSYTSSPYTGLSYYTPSVEVFVNVAGDIVPYTVSYWTSGNSRGGRFEAKAGTSYYFRIGLPPVPGGVINGSVGYGIPDGFRSQLYVARNPDLAGMDQGDGVAAWLHFYNYGVFEGRQFGADFIHEEYLELNPDVKAAFGNDRRAVVMHWFDWGIGEGRLGRVPQGFHVDRYLANYPDLNAAFGGITPIAVRNVTVWNHFLEYGVREGRTDGDFNAYDYLAQFPDVAAAFGSDVEAATLHWYHYGRKEGRRIPPGFRADYYGAWNWDVSNLYDRDLYGYWEHYRDIGVFEGRVFDQFFRADEYLQLNPDLMAAFGNDVQAAALHWVYYGKFEGRQGRY